MRVLKILIIFVAFSIILISPSSSKTDSSIQNQDTFVQETPLIETSPLDPATNWETLGIGYLQLMYEGLIQYANNSLITYKPALATTWFLSNDGLTYTFTIRTGVKFALQPGETVGQPFNAYVMQYSIDRAIIMNDYYGPAWMIEDWIKGAQSFEGGTINITQANTFLSMKSVWATDATHLQITLRAPFGGFFSTLLSTPVASAISPKAIIDNKPNNYTTSPDPMYGMVSLASFFPGTDNSTILSNLGLPSNYYIDNSGVVPQSDYINPNAFAWLETHSAGTGPYMLTDIVQGDHVNFVKNTNWWDFVDFQTNSPTFIKIIQVTDANTIFLDLKEGSIDEGIFPSLFLFDLLHNLGVTSSHLTSNTTGINIYVYNFLNNYFIAMNQADTLDDGQVVEDPTTSNYNYGTTNVTKLLKYSWDYPNGSKIMASPGNPFSSLLFRKAFAYAFPYDQYLNQAFDGFAIRMQGAIPQGLLGHDDTLIENGNIPDQNLTYSKQLFEEVGWKGTITMYYNFGSSDYQMSALLLKNVLEILNVGISINVVSISFSTLYSSIKRGGIAIWNFGWAPDYADPHDFTVPYYLGDVGFFSKALHYDNPEVNKLVEAGASTYSPSERTAIYHQLEVNATGDYVYIYLDQIQGIYFLRDWIYGVDDPSTNALNPMLYHQLPLQFLAKGGNRLLTTQSKSTTSSFISTKLSTTSIPGFEFGVIIGFPIMVVLVTIKRKKNSF